MLEHINRREVCRRLAAGLAAAGQPFAGAANSDAGTIPSIRSMSLEDKIGQLICGRMVPKDVKGAEELAAKGRAGSFIQCRTNTRSLAARSLPGGEV